MIFISILLCECFVVSKYNEMNSNLSLDFLQYILKRRFQLYEIIMNMVF
jgi:hypothetical protein